MRNIWIFLLLLSGCVSIPKATSVDDCCDAVGQEAKYYAAERNRGKTLVWQFARIEFYLDRYPMKERDKMRDTVKYIYEHPELEGESAAADVKNLCVVQRKSGDWFKDKASDLTSSN